MMRQETSENTGGRWYGVDGAADNAQEKRTKLSVRLARMICKWQDDEEHDAYLKVPINLLHVFHDEILRLEAIEARTGKMIDALEENEPYAIMRRTIEQADFERDERGGESG